MTTQAVNVSPKPSKSSRALCRFPMMDLRPDVQPLFKRLKQNKIHKRPGYPLIGRTNALLRWTSGWMQCAGSRIPARCGRCGFLRPPRRIQAEPLPGEMWAGFDGVPHKAKEICPLHREGRGHSPTGKIFFILLCHNYAAPLFAALAPAKNITPD